MAPSSLVHAQLNKKPTRQTKAIQSTYSVSIVYLLLCLKFLRVLLVQFPFLHNREISRPLTGAMPMVQFKITRFHAGPCPKRNFVSHNNLPFPSFSFLSSTLCSITYDDLVQKVNRDLSLHLLVCALQKHIPEEKDI
jgi:hypothetical protein